MTKTKKRLSQKGSLFFRLAAKKKEENRSSLLNARRYLAFVQTKTKVVFKNYTPNQVMMLPPVPVGVANDTAPKLTLSVYC
jgi:hypothetical protein